jgi:predicted HicB family RNase H-like nuclease
MDDAPKRRGGRPPSKKRGKFSFRVTADLRANLEAEARVSGRPVSEIIEGRLERSYREADIITTIRQELRASRCPEAERFLAEQPDPGAEPQPPVQ